MGRSPARWRCCRQRAETRVTREAIARVRAGRPSRGAAALRAAVVGACAAGPPRELTHYEPQAKDVLVGLDGEALLKRLGPPELLRRERGDEYWRYRHHNCLIDVYLFVEPPTAEPRIIHVGVRRLSGAVATDAASCATVAAEFAAGEARRPARSDSY